MIKVRKHIRKIIYDNLHDKLSSDKLNKIMNEITEALFKKITIEMDQLLLTNVRTIDPKPLKGCYHQDVPLYYGSNKGINDTEYKLCFKCRKVVYAGMK